MPLNSFRFLILFCGCLFLLFIIQLIGRNHKNARTIQKSVLLLASYSFIYLVNWKFCVSILFVTLISFGVGLTITNAKNKKAWLATSIVLLVAILCYYKYTNFFIESISILLKNAVSISTLDIVAPVGISFYIFSSLSYLIDVYKGKYEGEKNILNYSLYIAFFPKLLAGPIIRYDQFTKSTKDYVGLTLLNFHDGIQIFVFGLFKKMVLADHLGVFVDDIFFAPDAYNTGTIVLAVISYSLQIYLDFSGYSDMAIGISKILGFDFPANFNLPYLAKNVSEFWKRWHISLSSWLQEYVYFPLGGSRKGLARTFLNLMLVMIISGLWHGAGWTFIVWGGLYGVSSCVQKLIGNKTKKNNSIVLIICTYVLVSLLWIFFRADSLETAFKVFAGLFTIHSGISQPYTWSFFAIICVISATIVVVYRGKKRDIHDNHGELIIDGFYPILDLSKFWSMVAFFTFCGLTIIMGYYGNTAFIYGAF